MKRTLVWVPARIAVAGFALLVAGSATGAGERDVVVNEVHGWGGDWVEIYNSGGAAVDISGWRIADCDAQGRTRLTRALTFPRGSVLGPGGYLLVVPERGKGKKKRHREETDVDRICASRSATRCYDSSWKISQKGGDVVRLISRDGRLLSEATYPAGVVASTQSWSRLPNGTGAFAVGEPTPGRANAAVSVR